MRTQPLFAIALLFALAHGAAAAQPAKEATVRDIGSRLELFVDDWLIEKLDGARLELHHPVPRETVLRFDKPWEGIHSGYVTVLKDGDTFRMYYRGRPSGGKDGDTCEVTCYAESRDGITWTRPNLGLFGAGGTRENNVVLANCPPATHNFCPFLDTRPGCPPAERFRAVGGLRPQGLFAFVSPDGIHWKKLREEPVFAKGAFDSQNVAFWSEAEGCYVCYFRIFVGGIRSIARTTSKDFLTWAEPEPMAFGDAPREHLYTNQTQPYFRAPHLYVATPARFFPGRRVLTPEQAKSVNVEPRYAGDCSDNVLMTSRGGSRYNRAFLEAFIRPGLGYENWVSRCNYPALGIVPTGPGEMSLYVQRNYAQPANCLQRLTLRTDGFVSVNAPYRGGEMVTRPLTFAGKELVINYATSAAGSLQVELQDADGQPLPGHALADCLPILGDEIERVVAWKAGPDLAPLAGKPVRLRVLLRDADLYAIRFW